MFKLFKWFECFTLISLNNIVQERQVGFAEADHCYSRPWNWRPDGVHTHPTKTIFVSQVARTTANNTINTDRNILEIEEPIEVEEVEESSIELPYDEQKSNKVMGECERFGEFANPDALSEDEMDDWEEHISKDGWLPRQNKLFIDMLNPYTTRLKTSNVINANMLLQKITISKDMLNMYK